MLTQGLYTLLGQYGQGWQRVAAGSFITLVVPLVLFFSLRPYWADPARPDPEREAQVLHRLELKP